MLEARVTFTLEKIKNTISVCYGLCDRVRQWHHSFVPPDLKWDACPLVFWYIGKERPVYTLIFIYTRG